MARTQNKDGEFTAFVHAHYQPLLRTALLLTGDVHGAEDLVQAALTRLYVRWDAAAAADAPLAYARKVLLNLFRTGRRRRWWSEVSTAAPPERADADDVPARTVRRRVLAAALAELPRDQRAVLVLRFYEDLSVEETAVVLGCGVGTVKSRTSRALARLRATDSIKNFEGMGSA